MDNSDAIIRMRCPACGVKVKGQAERFASPVKCPKCNEIVLFEPADARRPSNRRGVKSTTVQSPQLDEDESRRPNTACSSGGTVELPDPQKRTRAAADSSGPTTKPDLQAPALSPVVQALSHGLRLAPPRVIAITSIWFLGCFSILSIGGLLCGLWSNVLWEEWYGILYVVSGCVLLCLIVTIMASLDSRVRAGRPVGFDAAMQSLGSESVCRCKEFMRLALTPLLTKGMWVALVLLAMIPTLHVGQMLLVLMWPFRFALTLATWVLLLRLLIYSLLTPLVKEQTGLSASEALASTKQLVRTRFFYFLEAFLWIGVLAVLLLRLVNGAIELAWGAAVHTQGNAPASSLYQAAPSFLKGLLTLPCIQNPFSMAPLNSQANIFDLVFSSILVVLHLCLLVPILVYVLQFIVLPLRQVVRVVLPANSLEIKEGGN